MLEIVLMLFSVFTLNTTEKVQKKDDGQPLVEVARKEKKETKKTDGQPLVEVARKKALKK